MLSLGGFANSEKFSFSKILLQVKGTQKNVKHSVRYCKQRFAEVHKGWQGKFVEMRRDNGTPVVGHSRKRAINVVQENYDDFGAA